MSHLEELQILINNCEIEMIKRASKMFDSFMHITQIPGINTLSAILIISEIGIDMTQFESDKQLVSWAGLAPANNESANKKKSVRISKAGQYLKPLMVQCALGAIKDKESYFGIKYTRIKKRRGHKKAIIAIVLNRTLYQRKIKKNCKIKKPMDGALCRIQLHNVPSFIWLYRSYGL